MRRFSSEAGIAIGPILFVIAILGVLAALMSSSGGGFGVASVADRVSADIVTQTNLIRSKINECNLLYGTNNNGDGWPSSNAAGTLVSALECEGDQATDKNIWTGVRALLLPPPTAGFEAWYYVNADDEGGRCIWTSPTGVKTIGVKTGLTQAASKFSSQEVSYDENSDSQKFVVFITRPTGTVDSHCTVP